MRYSDNPITNPAEDQLERQGFARTLAEAIDKLAIASEGFVMAITGEWGSGKSSVVALIRYYLVHLEMQRASNVHHYVGDPVDALQLYELDDMASLFERVSKVQTLCERDNLDPMMAKPPYFIGRFRRELESDNDASRAYRYWRLRLYIDANPSTIILSFSPWLISGQAELAAALLRDLDAAIGSHLGPDVRKAFDTYITVLGKLAPTVGGALSMTGFGPIGNFTKALGQLLSPKKDRPLDAVKQDLSNRLRKVDKKILIIIDDLDRLDPQGAFKMISLIKGLGDLPNVVYLLSYDDDRLVKLLDCALGVCGRNYLDKIVQYQTPLPITAVNQLHSLLAECLKDEWNKADDQSNTNYLKRRRFDQAWDSVIRHFVRTPRDVWRLANHYTMTASALADHTDFIDLLVLETLRTFESGVYAELRNRYAGLTE